jgi:proteic killer suppression protein
MKITFSTKKIEKLANDHRQCQKVFGYVRAKLFTKRLLDLQNAETLEDVRFLPGNYHELVGNRKGQWSCDLDQPYRLIFEPHENPVPEDKTGRFLWYIEQ